VQSKIFSANKTLNAQGRFIDLSAPKVMGILNVTSDSFYEGSRLPTVADVLQRAETMVLEGRNAIPAAFWSGEAGNGQ